MGKTVVFGAFWKTPDQDKSAVTNCGRDLMTLSVNRGILRGCEDWFSFRRRLRQTLIRHLRGGEDRDPWPVDAALIPLSGARLAFEP
jgi:hypothetical protein